MFRFTRVLYMLESIGAQLDSMDPRNKKVRPLAMFLADKIQLICDL